MHSALQSPVTKPFSLCFFPQDIDGQALLLLTLPTVQECMELKLGPAIKLCHQIERVKVAFYAQYANWLYFYIPSCPPPCSLSFLPLHLVQGAFFAHTHFLYWEQLELEALGAIHRGKKNKNKKKRATNGTNFSVLVKHMERLLASLLLSLSNPLPSGARPAGIRWFVTKPNLPVADTFPRRRVRRFQVVVVCLGQFLDMNLSFRQLWHSSFILKCKSSFVALPGV